MKVGEVIERLNSKRATRKVIAEELGMSQSTLTRRIGDVGYVYDQVTKTYNLPEPNPEIENIEISDRPNGKVAEVQTSTIKNTDSAEKNTDSAKSTQMNQEVHQFSQDEIDVLKQLVRERKRDIKLFSGYQVYEELSKVPMGVEQVRSAFNMSKETTERLKKYASERRLPLQDLVELFVINGLEQYEKK